MGSIGLPVPILAMTEQVRTIARERVVGEVGNVEAECLPRSVNGFIVGWRRAGVQAGTRRRPPPGNAQTRLGVVGALALINFVNPDLGLYGLLIPVVVRRTGISWIEGDADAV